MVCYLSCSLAFALIGASVFTVINTHKKVLISDFVKTLDAPQRKVYDEIATYRLKIYVQGMILGLLLAGLYMSVVDKKSSSETSKVCMFILITMATQYFYYTFTPKPKYMIDYLKTPESVKAWHSVGKHMSKMYHIGFVVGLIGYCLLAYGFGKENK